MEACYKSSGGTGFLPLLPRRDETKTRSITLAQDDMSAFDLVKIVDSLQSSRVKQRNDALSLLASFAPSKLRLSSRQFVALLSGLVTFIETEKAVYANNPSAATDLRLLTASTVLKDIVEECIRSVDLRYKHCLPVFQGVMLHFFLPSGSVILAPCALSLANILAVLLREKSFITHITADMWRLSLRFLLRAVSAVTNQASTPSPHTHYLHESLLKDLLSSTFVLLGGDSASNYVQLIAERSYLSFAPVLENVLAVFGRRESPVLIFAFKIITKLLNFLSSEDFVFSNRLARMAVRSMIAFSSTQVESLLQQFSALLNSDAFHNCIDISALPQLTETLPIISSQQEDPETVSATATDESGGNYAIGVLLHGCIFRLVSQPQRLDNDDLLPQLRGQNAPVESSLPSMKLSSDKTLLWLMYEGTARLLHTFYTLKTNTTAETSSAKRIKLQYQPYDPWSFDNEFYLLTSMIDELSDLKVRTCGLMLMAFLLNLHPVFITHNNSHTQGFYGKPTQENPPFTSSQFSILLLHHDAVRSSHQATTSEEDYLLMLQSSISVFSSKSSKYAALLACHAFLVNAQFGDNESNRVRLANYLKQIMKVTLSLITEKEHSSLASLIFSFVVNLYPQKSLDDIADAALLSQVESLVDLSEISGPFSVEDNAFFFWWTIHVLITKVGNRKKTDISVSAGRWLLAKLNEHSVSNNVLRKERPFFPFGSPKMLAVFCLWLQGLDGLLVTYETEAQKGDHQSLYDFIFFKEHFTPNRAPPQYNILPCEGNTYIFNTFLEKLSTISTAVANGEENTLVIYLWASSMEIMLSEISSRIPEYNQDVCDAKDALFASLSHNVSDKNQALALIRQINHDQRSMAPGKYPLQMPNILIDSFFEEAAEVAVPSFGAMNQLKSFDDEFSPTAELRTPGPKYDASQIKPGFVDFFDYLVLSRDDGVQAASVYSSSMDPKSLIVGLRNLFGHVRSKEALQKLNLEDCRKLVRVFGDGPLSSPEIARDDDTLEVALMLIRLFLPRALEAKDDGLSKDCMDLIVYILQCGQKHLLLTDRGQECLLETCLLTMYLGSDGRDLATDLKTLFLKTLPSVPNCIVLRLPEGVLKYLSTLDNLEQMTFYGDVFQAFPTPQQSVEKAATFCYFLSAISTESTQLRVSALFNLIECSSFEFFVPYLKKAVQRMCGTDEPLWLFRRVKLELLKFWWECGLDPALFPFILFGLLDFSSFVSECYKELTAIAIAADPSKGEARSQQLLRLIAQVRQSDMHSLVCDALPLLIPLAYTSRGVRNNVFKALLPFLNDTYKRVMKEKLFLLVLHTIRLTDVSQEAPFKKLFSGSKWADLLDSTLEKQTSFQATVSPSSSTDLIKALISKFWRDELEPFWSVRSGYFLVRQLAVDLSRAGADGKVLHLRRIKLALCLGDTDTDNSHLGNLLLQVCHLLLADGLHEDAFKVLLKINPVRWHDLDVNHAFVSLARLLLDCGSIHSDTVRSYRWPSTFYGWLASSSALGSATQFVTASLAAFVDGPKALDFTALEAFLADQQFYPSIHHHSSLLVEYFLALYAEIAPPKVEETTVDVVRLLMMLDLTKARAGGFLNWASAYLAQHFLTGKLHESTNMVVPRLEYRGFDKSDVHEALSSLDFFVDLMVEVHSFADLETAAFLECIFGAMLQKCSSTSDLSKVLTTDKFKATFGGYLAELDFHSCFLLIAGDQDRVLQEDDLASWLESTPAESSGSAFKSWSHKLLFLLVQELASYTSFAALMSSFVMKLPQEAASVTNKLLCYYACCSEKALSDTRMLLVKLSALKLPDDLELAKFYCDLLLHIRVGAKANIPEFIELYGVAYPEDFFSSIPPSKKAKSSLMMLEDHEHNEFDWTRHRKCMIDLYELIDDVDLLFGIPEDPSLPTALQMMEKTGECSEKLQNDLAYFENSESAPNYRRVVGSMAENGLFRNACQVTSCLNEKPNRDWYWKMGKFEAPAVQEPTSGLELVYNYFKRQVHFDSADALHLGLQEAHELKSLWLPESLSDRHFGQKLLAWFTSVACIVSADEILKLDEPQIPDALVSFRRSSAWFEDANIELSEDVLLARRLAFFSRAEKPVGEPLSLVKGATFEIARYNEIACASKHYQRIMNSAVLLEQVTKDTSVQDEELRRVSLYRAAHSLWTRGIADVPIAMLKAIDEGPFDQKETLGPLAVTPAKVRAQLVTWLADSSQDLGVNIMERYVKTVHEVMVANEDAGQRAAIYQSLARFCEQQYKLDSLGNHITALGDRVRSKAKEVEDIKTHYGQTSVTPSEKKAVQKYYNRLKGQMQAEQAELDDLMATRTKFARQAACLFLQELLVSDVADEDADRFLSLFLDHSGDQELQSELQHMLPSLPSQRALDWSSQLMARLTDKKSTFQQSIQHLLFRVCHDYPFHALYMLLSLIYHESAANKTANTAMLSRVAAAKLVREKLMATSASFLNEQLLPVERVSREAILLAEMKCSKGKPVRLDKTPVGDFWLNELPQIPPPTLTIPVVQLSQWKKLPAMVAVNPKVAIASSGLSLPKIMTMSVSDGSCHKMLLKSGTDDLRQDSTMEQVFGKVNRMLEKDKETRKRRLRVRTYNAVPLGPTAGVIEFVAHSKAFIEIIRPYHQREDQMKSEKAREMMKQCQDSDVRHRQKVYGQITNKIRPVLRHYFADNFVTPDKWFDSRMVYTRGVASSSMIGHILGLGDRHCNNILLDEFTGEPIHIDLGVAFDQGKRLPIPETVPFRLTRDIVDGFGFLGVRGVFTKLCEHTFRVLQQHKEQILSIVDALRWDPLHSWSISPIRKQKLQDGENNGDIGGVKPHEDGSDASTALLTVTEKLDARNLSVDATVRELIREATSDHNLAVIYCGWCPFF